MAKINVICKDMGEAIKDHFDLFKKDFYIANEPPQDAEMVLYLEDKDKYIVFKENDIEDTINEWAKEFMIENKWFEDVDEWADTKKDLSQL